MAAYDKITLEGEHGQYQTRVGSLDLIMQRYLKTDVSPEAVEEIQAEIREINGDSTYTVTTITEALMILAELRGFATN